MKKPLKMTLGTLGAVAACVAVAAAGLLLNSQRKLDRVVAVAVAPVPYVTDAQALESGKYLYMTRCIECHGRDGDGAVFINEPNGLYLAGSNLTTGRGSAVASYSETDWVRTIRHGVKPSGRPVFIMPSEDFNRLSDRDLASLVAYVRSLPAKDGNGAIIRLPLIVRLIHGAGVMKDSAEKIDHSLPPSQPIPVGITTEHGRYVAQACVGCHGVELKGGSIAGAPPHWPPAAQLTGPGSVIARYATAEQFKTLLRTGARPDGTKTNEAMPTNQHLNDVDLEAIYLYFKSTQAAATSVSSSAQNRRPKS
ncbi:c-type cytochrome [Piscinibacter sp. HJYY11]|uniref:c-type cytochrome n=1 Tax=Piscinibacter sp. HJYY11 TaxID=2801333 RepID=UPI00191CBF91|nr:c-type cytochrome [Piscinibacter sp. HJYY11]MBL0727277.1 c-type cytochrome [Piscinibacter sp. HJYY11]